MAFNDSVKFDVEIIPVSLAERPTSGFDFRPEAENMTLQKLISMNPSSFMRIGRWVSEKKVPHTYNRRRLSLGENRPDWCQL